jgi:hypothetical protein
VYVSPFASAARATPILFRRCGQNKSHLTGSKRIKMFDRISGDGDT